ncbi:MAG TPA: PqqD family protein [Solirubrobacteraceae bacterium]|nr:PqqD family protein [Solirubrobacteraceae bacterium]
MLGFPVPRAMARTMTDHNPRRRSSLEVNEAEDGLVVYDPATDMVHHLNPSAALIFDLCDGSRDPESIARVVGEVFGIQPPPLEETHAGLHELAGQRLITWGIHRDES